MKNCFVGIDVSKDTIDICLLKDLQESLVIKNSKRDILKFIKSKLKDGFNYYICFENTGKYSWLLTELLIELDFKVYLVNPLHLKRSMGLVRGKNDKIDAIRIANFIKKNYEDINVYLPLREELTMIKILLSERNFKVKQKRELNTKNKDLVILSNKSLAKSLIRKNKKIILELEKQIKEIEKEIKLIIKLDDSLNILNKLLQSVPGVGDILSWNIIIKTNEFKTIKTPRKLACYAGVAPFHNSSGTSIFGKNRVSYLADKDLKRLLHLGAMSAIRLENNFKKFYLRKVKEGKNKMSVLNAVRNKIIHTCYALVKNQTFYKNNLVMS